MASDKPETPDEAVPDQIVPDGITYEAAIRRLEDVLLSLMLRVNALEARIRQLTENAR